MKLIVGLGNPGVRYENTRHNAGFMVIDEIARRMETPVDRKKFEGSYVKTRYRGEDVVLLKPETYMNNSGFSVRACMDFFKIAPEDLLVIYDDMDTEVGSIRLRTKGSAGGHNGMKSVISCAMTDTFDRIRVGIGRNRQMDIADYVLSRFKPEEIDPLNEAIDHAASAVLFSISQGFNKAMNRYNVKPKKKKEPVKEEASKSAETYTAGEDEKSYSDKADE